MTKEQIKYKIAYLIVNSYVAADNPSYATLLEIGYENIYRCVSKVPITVFFNGLVEHFVKDDSTELKNKIVNIIKEVVVDMYQESGCECTFTDMDWMNLKYDIVSRTNHRGRVTEEVTLTGYSNKGYICEFIEN